MPIIFSAICPHPPLILATVGSPEDRVQVKNTISSLEKMGRDMKKAGPEKIIISSPHLEWGFNVPLSFLAGRTLDEDGGGENIQPYLIGADAPEFYFEEGRGVYGREIKNSKSKFALIASGDLSHRLKEDGPYGFHSDGPKFDQALVEALNKKNISAILKLDELYPQAGECGLGSFAFMIGILEAARVNWQADILSYEGPFGVGYLVANVKLQNYGSN